MPFIEIEVDGETVSRRESTFGDDSWNEQVADTLNGRNLRAFPKSSRQRRKENLSALGKGK